LEVQGVTRSFGDTVVLRGVDLTVEAGSRHAIVGPSGSGKTTLLHLMGLLDTPSSGSVRLLGEAAPTTEDARAAARREHLGFVFQDHHLLPQCSALDNVLVPCFADGAPSGADVAKARALLERLELADRIGHFPSQLSTGQRQRVAVARALIRDPKLVLADEPTGSLDRALTEELVRLLLGLDVAVVVVTHNAVVADAFDRCWTLGDGRLTG
jgi:lipoprotein-releasing system ATP-binding protein